MVISTSTSTAMAVSIKDAAKMIGLGRTSFYNLLNSGQIRPIRLGGRVLVPISELVTLIERPQSTGSAQPRPPHRSRKQA